ncbi:MAG TPA: flagellar biosynthetic protein FliQ, partial [Anaeromyxobacteraceae bacterium]|nr:flagellar biosynthetic protein FliQ [Anaeromyxobacteraceae bacterium]
EPDVDPSLLRLGREGLALVAVVSAPPLLAALLVGLVVGVLQAATQVQEQSIGTVPRLAAVIGALALAAPWIGARLVTFASECLALAARISP